MSDYLNIGSTPCDESCAQIGQEGYHQQMRKESRAFINQLERVLTAEFGDKVCVTLTNKSFPHDYGTYHEVCAVYNDEESMTQAFWLEANTPEHWDKQALKELA